MRLYVCSHRQPQLQRSHPPFQTGAYADPLLPPNGRAPHRFALSDPHPRNTQLDRDPRLSEAAGDNSPSSDTCCPPFSPPSASHSFVPSIATCHPTTGFALPLGSSASPKATKQDPSLLSSPSPPGPRTGRTRREEIRSKTTPILRAPGAAAAPGQLLPQDRAADALPAATAAQHHAVTQRGTPRSPSPSTSSTCL